MFDILCCGPIPLLTCNAIHSTVYFLWSLQSELPSLNCLETRVQPGLTLAAKNSYHRSQKTVITDLMSILAIKTENLKMPNESSLGIRTQSSAVPKFLRSMGLFQPASPYLVRNLTRLCNMHRLWSRAGHSARMLTRIRSPSTHWRERCKLSFVFCQRKIKPASDEHQQTLKVFVWQSDFMHVLFCVCNCCGLIFSLVKVFQTSFIIISLCLRLC